MKLLTKILIFILLVVLVFGLGMRVADDSYEPSLQVEDDKPLSYTSIEAVVTAYSKYETCPNEKCITASGTSPRENRTIACPRHIPFKTEVEIMGRRYVCEDRTHYRFDGRYDIFVSSYEEAIQWGKRTINIKILTKN